MTLLYKIMPREEWQTASTAKTYPGSTVDVRDGFIHLSTAAQVRETAAKHFANQPDLVLLAIPEASLKQDLRWEVSRGGALFPHLYAALDVSTVAHVWPLPWSGSAHQFPDEIA